MIVAITPHSFPSYCITAQAEVYRLKSGNFARVPTFLDRNGYERVMAYDSTGKRKRVAVHRMVYEAFHGKLTDGLCIDHLDGDKKNNRPENLEEVSFAENTLRQKRDRPQPAYNRKLSIEQAKEIRAERLKGGSYPKIAEKWGLHWSSVRAICKGAIYQEKGP